MLHSETVKLLDERRKVARLSQVREIVFGTEDGLLVPLGVVSGVAGATTNSFYALIAGLAEAFAGSISMGAGEYLSSKSEHEVQQWAIAKEMKEVETVPEEEKREIVLLFENEGLSTSDASKVADLITTSKKSWIRTMVEKELGLSAEPIHSGGRDALVMSLSYLGGSLFPIVQYLLLPMHAAVPFSICLTLIALFGLGVYKAKLAHGNTLRGGLEVMVIGAFAAGVGYLLGTLLSSVLGMAGITVG
jgi:VIT1/CCC1 family predicted Fe2+/Mn2+ transporter